MLNELYRDFYKFTFTLINQIQLKKYNLNTFRNIKINKNPFISYQIH